MNESSADDEGAKKQTQKKGTGQKTSRYIMPTIENFRRSKKGFKLISQQCEKLIQLQAKTFPARSMLNLDGNKISYQFNGINGCISLSDFLLKAPYFMDLHFVQIRRKLDFGARVQEWLVDMEEGMKKFYKFKKLQEFVWSVAKCEIANLRGLEADQLEEDEPEDNEDVEAAEEQQGESDSD